MAEQELTRAAVRHASLKGKAPVACIHAVKGICVGAVESADVKASPIAGPALAALLGTLADTDDAYQKKLTLQQALRAANKAVALQTAKLRNRLFMYETAVDGLADGDAGVISHAGLPTRAMRGLSLALDRVAQVRSKQGKLLGETIVSWSKGPGATSYAIEVNYNPTDPTSPWVALKSGAGRRRVIKAPTPGGEILVRVASLGSDGSQSEWSDTHLATAR